MLQLDPSSAGISRRDALFMHNLAVDDELYGLDRCYFANRPHTRADVVRPRAGFVDDAPGCFPVHVQEEQRTGSNKAAALRHTLKPRSKIRPRSARP